LDRAMDWVDQVNHGRLDVIQVTADDLRFSTEIFFKYSDKFWSFTDCTSRVLMERLGIQTAFAFDDHFRQFGTVVVLP
jgi:predicted nucleic acid-binding protein